MVRRLLAQFGLTAVIVALGAGAAMADSATVGAVASSDSSTTTVITTPTATPPTNQGPTNPTNTPPTTPILSSLSPVVATPSDSNTTPGTGSTTSTPPTTPTGTTTHPTTTSPSTNPPASPPTATAVSTPNVGMAAITGRHVVASIDQAGSFSALAAPSQSPPPVANPNHSTPSNPAPVGLLNQLHILLISTLVPASRLAHSAAQGAAASHAGLIATAIILVLTALAYLATSVPANTHTARLRRSGFLGAARSDVSVANLLFATPREMSSMRLLAIP